MSQNSQYSPLVAGVDRAALVLAVLAGATTLSFADGNWSALSTFVGVLLLSVVAGFHQRVSGGTVAAWLSRIAFGLSLSLTLLVTLAWPMQRISGSPYVPVATLTVIIYAAIGLASAIFEPAICGLLERHVRNV